MELEIQQGEKKMGTNETLQEEIENKLNQSVLFVVDRIEEDEVICENRTTQEILAIAKDQFSWNVREGDVFQKKGEQLVRDDKEKEVIEKRIQDKMKQLWNK